MSSPSSKPRSKGKHVFSGVPIPENFKGNVYIGEWVPLFENIASVQKNRPFSRWCKKFFLTHVDNSDESLKVKNKIKCITHELKAWRRHRRHGLWKHGLWKHGLWKRMNYESRDRRRRRHGCHRPYNNRWLHHATQTKTYQRKTKRARQFLGVGVCNRMFSFSFQNVQIFWVKQRRKNKYYKWLEFWIFLQKKPKKKKP